MSKTYTVRLNNDEKFIEDFANFQGVSVSRLLKDIATEHIEDIIDVQAAELELAKIESGESELTDWEDFINE